jgi:predicted nucleic acid-binding protein
MLAATKAGSAAATLLASERLSAPAHFDAEVYSAFRRHFRQRLMPRPALDGAMARLVALTVERVPLPMLLPAAHELADALSVGDAFYVALARLRDIELVTADARLARAAAHLANLRLIAG